VTLMPLLNPETLCLIDILQKYATFNTVVCNVKVQAATARDVYEYLAFSLVAIIKERLNLKR
jgi:hypothetical protein